MAIADDRRLAAVSAGDEMAFLSLCREHTPRLFAVVLRMVGRRPDAEDAVQEAWLRAVRGLSGFRRDSSFLTWMTGIGIRCAQRRVVSGMRTQQLLRRANRQPWLQVAAALVLLASGIGIGKLLAPAPVVSPPRVQSRYMLLLWGAAPVADDNARAREYGVWASAQQQSGREISGERLADDALLIERDRPSSPVPAEVQGFFIVSAASLEDAAAVARSSPHVRDGGRIVVRPIDTP